MAGAAGWILCYRSRMPHHRPIRLSLLLVALFAAASGSAPRAVADEFILPDDLEIALWAEYAMFFNPTNVDVDEADASGLTGRR